LSNNAGRYPIFDRASPSSRPAFLSPRDHWTVFQNFLRAGEDGLSERDRPGDFRCSAASWRIRLERGRVPGRVRWLAPMPRERERPRSPSFPEKNRERNPCRNPCFREFLSRRIRSACPMPDGEPSRLLRLVRSRQGEGCPAWASSRQQCRAKEVAGLGRHASPELKSRAAGVECDGAN
jgi:hypothetical protein